MEIEDYSKKLEEYIDIAIDKYERKFTSYPPTEHTISTVHAYLHEMNLNFMVNLEVSNEEVTDRIVKQIERRYEND